MGLAEEAILSSNFYAVSNRISSLLEDFNFYYAKLYHFYLCISEEIQNTKIRESVSYALYVLESDFKAIVHEENETDEIKWGQRDALILNNFQGAITLRDKIISSGDKERIYLMSLEEIVRYKGKAA